MSLDISLTVLGTDPEQKNGGIAFAIPGHLSAYRELGLVPIFIATHSSSGCHGKWLPWLKALPKLFRQLMSARKNSHVPIVFCHVGGGALSMLRKFILACLGRMLGGRVVMHFHGPEVNNYLASRFGRYVISAVLAPAHAVVVLTPWWHSRLFGAGVSKPIYVVPNPLPPDWQKQAELPRVYPKDQEIINILAVARLESGKGLDDLIEAMVLLPDNFRLAIAGSGRQHDELKELIDFLNLQHRVRLCGWVSGAKKQALFDQADIFCLPSRYDSFGMGYLEAMANGLPVVAYNWGPIADVVADNRCGYLAAEYTPAALAESIKRMDSASCRKALGEGARLWVLEKFTVSRVAQNVKRLLEFLCQ